MAEIDERQAQDGIRYDVRFRVNGKQRKKTFRVKKHATDYLKTVHADEVRGLVLDPQGGEVLFGPYATEWLETRLVKGEPLTPATKQGYFKLLGRNINPYFDKTRLRQIDAQAVRKWHTALVKEKGTDQAAKSYRLMRAILRTAVADGLKADNPCTIPGAGSERTRERPLLETETVLKLSLAITPRLRSLVLLGGLCGLRPGELLGLQRQDVDLLHRTVTIKRQSHEINGQGRIYIDHPKTDAGRRTIHLPAPLPEILTEDMAAFVAAAPDASLFVRPSGLPLRRADLSEEWKLAYTAVGLAKVEPHVHDLRHSAATTMARNPSITLKELMAWGGWTTPTVAMRYQHASEERAREHADYLEGVIAAAQSAPESAPVPLRP